MSDRKDCKWCGFSYTAVKQGREYLYHDEATCEFKSLKKELAALQERIDGFEAMLDAREESRESDDGGG